MGEILLSELIDRTKDAVRSFGHSWSTSYQYEMGWTNLSGYFLAHHQVLYSKQLAEQYLLELKANWKDRTLQRWRYKLYRLTALLVMELEETGQVTWKSHEEDPPTYLHQPAYLLLHRAYQTFLRKEGKKPGTIQIYEIVSRQFLEYLEGRKVREPAEVQAKDVSAFLPFIAQQYQPGSMRTVLSALRCFIRYIESQQLTASCLNHAVPSSSGRTTRVVPMLTSEEEQKLLNSVDGTTGLGKRNYAMLLLALRTGLRSIDIINLKLSDVHWQSNTLEIVQAKTSTLLVLPLLTDVGNALADYILNGRPSSPEPYIFLRTQAPHQKLSGRSACYGVSCKMMKAAGIRQGPGDQKGFHCLRHSLAVRLLLEETPLPIISSILGHRNKDSTRDYLSSDLLHLRACALDLTSIEVTKEELL
jgi:integrase